MDAKELQQALPARLKDSLTQSSISSLLNTLNDPAEIEAMKDNFITYAHVLEGGKYKVDSYVNAIKYVTFKLMGLSNFDAYTRTFPDRYNNYISNGTPLSTIHTYVHSFNTSKLVTQLMEQSVIPTHIMYKDCFHEALFVQMALMKDTNVSDKVRSDAAAHVMNHTRPPDVKKVELDVSVKSDPVLNDLMAGLNSYAESVRSSIVAKDITPKEAIEHSLITHKDSDE